MLLHLQTKLRAIRSEYTQQAARPKYLLDVFDAQRLLCRGHGCTFHEIEARSPELVLVLLDSGTAGDRDAATLAKVMDLDYMRAPGMLFHRGDGRRPRGAGFG